MWSKMKLGNQQKHQTVGAHLGNLKAFNKIRRALELQMPKSFNCSAAVKEPLGMFLNGPNTFMKDTGIPVPAEGLGDCTKASKGMWLQCVHSAAGRPWKPTDAQILKAYEDCDGYKPGDDSTDQGGTLLGTEQFFMKNGIGGNILRASGLVNIHDEMLLKLAIWLSWGMDTGVALPLAWQHAEVWDGPSDPNTTDPQWQPGGWGGHDIILASYGYDYPGLAVNKFANKGTYDYGVMTWGQGGQTSPLIPLTKKGLAFIDEGRFLAAKAMLLDTGGTVSGLGWSKVIEELQNTEYPDPAPPSGDERTYHGN